MTGSRARHTPAPAPPARAAPGLSGPGRASEEPDASGAAEPTTRSRVPPHLRRYVVEQNYEEYNAVDQAVWRFVLTQIFETLRRTAHPAYEAGLAQTGIALEHIPRIEEMDRCLGRYGWGAVCVDGFIPPRAFVEFQALRILPIAADIRARQHLVYTPAPDIIHEAAGHAPILPDPAYAAYLARIGRVGAEAFGSPEDDAVYRAIFRLSELKERPDATAADVARAERACQEASEAVTRTTETARMSRLYWWTAEYGLVGTPTDYDIYGAGLLSSLGESHSCHGPEVRKVPLSEACLDVPYDITRAQPQLFVARDFQHLEEVLDTVSSSLAARRGGPEGLRIAELSEEVATLEVGVDGEDSIELIGIVAWHRQELGLLRVGLEGRVALARRGRIEAVLPAAAMAARGDETPVTEIFVSADPGALHGAGHPGAELALSLGGSHLTGIVGRPFHDQRRRLLLVTLEQARLGDAPLAGAALLATGRVLGVRAGASDPAYHCASVFPGRLVPEPRRFDATEQELLNLYEETATLVRSTWGAAAAAVLARLHERLRLHHPDEWLLRWNLLEALVRMDPEAAESSELWVELQRLEQRFSQREPIALGLRHLARLAAAR